MIIMVKIMHRTGVIAAAILGGFAHFLFVSPMCAAFALDNFPICSSLASRALKIEVNY